MNYDTHFKQIVLSLLASASCISSGMTLGFPAVALPAMNATNFLGGSQQNSTNALQSSQAFWIASLPQISMVLGCISAGPILDWKGRRIGLLLSNLVAISGWFIMALQQDLWSVLTGRLLTGFAMGFTNPVVLVYVSEIASPSLRSGLTVYNAITFSVGVTLTYIFGYFYRVEWRIVSGLCGIFPAICFLLMFFFLPEPKLWKGRMTVSVAKFMRPEVFKPMIIMLITLFFRQISGTNVVLSYTVEMVEQANVVIDSHLVSVVLGLVRIVGGVFSVWLSSQLGRRHPSIWTGLSMSFSMLALAVSFQLPTFALLMFILTSTVHASITQSMLAEVFPTDVRGVAASIAAVNIFLTGFLAIWIHHWIRLNSVIMFAYYGVMGLASTLFLYLFLPETHCKTLKEIGRIFNKNLIDNEEGASPLEPKKKINANIKNKT